MDNFIIYIIYVLLLYTILQFSDHFLFSTQSLFIIKGQKVLVIYSIFNYMSNLYIITDVFCSPNKLN